MKGQGRIYIYIYIYINMWRVIMNIVVVWAFEERVSLLIWVGMVVWSI